MKILLGYGLYPYTTGTYFERSVARRHECIYVGTPWGSRPGFAPDVNLPLLAEDLDAKPDLYLFVDSGHAAHMPRGLEKAPFPTACYLIDVHVDMKLRARQAALFDYVFVAQKDYMAGVRNAVKHERVYWLPLACDPEIHKRSDAPRVYDIGFVGALGGDCSERRAMLEALSRIHKVNDFRRSYSPAEMAQLYSQSKIVFNKSVMNEVNMRVFEATSCGAMLLTDRIGNGQEGLFEDRRQIVTYADMTEMLDLAEYYLRHDEERETIARGGHELAVTRHTYDARVDEILGTVFGATPPCLEAPARKWSSAQVCLAYAEIYSMLRLVDSTFDQMRGLRKLGKGRATAVTQVLFALLRRLKYG